MRNTSTYPTKEGLRKLYMLRHRGRQDHGTRGLPEGHPTDYLGPIIADKEAAILDELANAELLAALGGRAVFPGDIGDVSLEATGSLEPEISPEQINPELIDPKLADIMADLERLGIDPKDYIDNYDSGSQALLTTDPEKLEKLHELLVEKARYRRSGSSSSGIDRHTQYAAAQATLNYDLIEQPYV